MFRQASDVDLVLFGDELTLTDLAKLGEAVEALPIPQCVDLLRHRTISDEGLLREIEVHGVVWFDRACSKVET